METALPMGLVQCYQFIRRVLEALLPENRCRVGMRFWRRWLLDALLGFCERGFLGVLGDANAFMKGLYGYEQMSRLVCLCRGYIFAVIFSCVFKRHLVSSSDC